MGSGTDKRLLHSVSRSLEAPRSLFLRYDSASCLGIQSLCEASSRKRAKCPLLKLLLLPSSSQEAVCTTYSPYRSIEDETTATAGERAANGDSKRRRIESERASESSFPIAAMGECVVRVYSRKRSYLQTTPPEKNTQCIWLNQISRIAT